MRFPRQKYHGLLRLGRTLHLRQHALFAGLDQVEFVQTVEILLQHRQNQPVAVVAGFDAVDRMVQGRSEALNVIEVAQARLIGIRGHGQGVLGAAQVGAQHFDGALVHVALAVGFL
jgi:hypothetical protein